MKKTLLVHWNNRCYIWPWDLRAKLFLFTCLEFLGLASIEDNSWERVLLEVYERFKKEFVCTAVAEEIVLHLPLQFTNIQGLIIIILLLIGIICYRCHSLWVFDVPSDTLLSCKGTCGWRMTHLICRATLFLSVRIRKSPDRC